MYVRLFACLLFSVRLLFVFFFVCSLFGSFVHPHSPDIDGRQVNPRSLISEWFIPSLIHLVIYYLVFRLSIPYFIHSYVCLLIRSFVHLFVQLLVCEVVCLSLFFF